MELGINHFTKEDLKINDMVVHSTSLEQYLVENISLQFSEIKIYKTRILTMKTLILTLLIFHSMP